MKVIHKRQRRDGILATASFTPGEWLAPLMLDKMGRFSGLEEETAYTFWPKIDPVTLVLVVEVTKS